MLPAPTFLGSIPKPVKARLSSLGGSEFGQNLAAQVVSLSGRRAVTLLPRIGPQFRRSSNHCCFASFPRSPRNIAIPRTPAGLASEYCYSADDPFAPPLPESSGFAGLPSGSGVGSGLRLCLTLLPGIALPPLLRRSSLRMSAASRDGPGLPLSFVSEGPLPTADYLHDSAFRVAPSGIFTIQPVDNVDNVDKFSSPCRIRSGKASRRPERS